MNDSRRSWLRYKEDREVDRDNNCDGRLQNFVAQGILFVVEPTCFTSRSSPSIPSIERETVVRVNRWSLGQHVGSLSPLGGD